MSRLDRFLKIAVVLIATVAAPCISGSIWGGAETMYVFYPSTIRPVQMQKKMIEACPNIRIMVFGRFVDFEAKVLADKPDAILTKSPVIQQLGGYSVALKGSRKGETEESNILVSADEKIDLNTVSLISIGMSDILGRDGMKKMAGSYFGQKPRLRFVSKIEDMLQLLILNMVKAILIPENHLPYFRELSNLNFAVTRLPNVRTGIIALAVRDGGSAVLSGKGLTGMDSKTMAMLEVDKWEK